MGAKKKKLLEKYLEKKKRQKDRDSLYERLRELQASRPPTATSISTLKRITTSKRMPSTRIPIPALTKETKPESAIDKSAIDNRSRLAIDPKSVIDNSSRLAMDSKPLMDNWPQTNPTLTQTTSTDDGILLFPIEPRTCAGHRKSQPNEESTTKKPAREEKAARIKIPKTHSKTRARQCNLPITYLEDEIVAAVKEYPVVLISGGPGTGKSTQVPQFLYENGMCHEKKLCITQPRRVSAKAIADRVSEEQEQEPGKIAGYRIRYESNVKDTTRIYVQTEGVLLQELADDPWLSAYSVVILDEVHERSVTSDTLLVLLLGIASRTGLRLVLMSAGITQEYAESVKNLAGRDVPLIQVPSQSHEVQIHYLPPKTYNYLAEVSDRIEKIEQEEQEKENEQKQEQKQEQQSTSILVFLPTKEETENMKQTLSSITSRSIHVLHSDTPSAQQKEILTGKHLLILATNIAETSLTLPDVKYVIDGGREVRRNYDYSIGSYSYSILMISKSSADQRSGRTGRTGPGICYRIYTIAEYERMQDSRPPEILRDNVLSCVIPLLKAGIRPSNISRMAYLTPPPTAAIAKELERLVRVVAEPDQLKHLKDGVSGGRLSGNTLSGNTLSSGTLSGTTTSRGATSRDITSSGMSTPSHTTTPAHTTPSFVDEKDSRMCLFDSMYASGVLNPAWAFPINPVLSSVLSRALKHSSTAIDVLVGICATIEVCGTKKIRNVYIPEPIEIQDKSGNRKYAYIEALSMLRTLPHQVKQRIDKIKKLLTKRMKNNTVKKDSIENNNAGPSADTIRDTVIPLLAYALRDNMVTLHKRRYYHGGEEVIVQSPMPDIDSESPVPILYHSLVTTSTSPIRKIYLHSIVIPSFIMPQ